MAHIAIQQENKSALLKVSGDASALFVLKPSQTSATKKEKKLSYLATKRNLLAITLIYTVILLAILFVLL